MSQIHVLVINCGSSSVKFSIIDSNSGQAVLTGIAERLLSAKASFKLSYQQQSEQLSLKAPYDHQAAITELVQQLTRLALLDTLSAVGHRVVHGGEHFSAPSLITKEVKQTIADLAHLAPLHNPANLTGINAAEKALGHLPQVAVFDTAFHQSMPEKAYLYGLPYELYQEHDIRRYGFHGSSHSFVAGQAANFIGKPLRQCSFISAHLGNGCSITAIKAGQSIDSSMGFTPLEGVMMGSRSGDLDPGIIFHLIEHLGYSPEQVQTLLNKDSGLLGLSGLSNDCRELEQAALTQGNKRAKLALEIFCYRIAKYIAALSASLTSLDGVIFTGGIGENSSYVREQVINQLSLLNFHLDQDKNRETRFGKSDDISTPSSRYALVIPTNEEGVIASQSIQVLQEVL
ncbi:acetate kinase [Thalassomonas actiniarum]|uniref:Acetate kinase n=1 Tax=Thalassomonas actiniarum TaxID=485447 RepID=A0AAE9YLS3_9GAMM|nr:acetate kinase [Thalassomonas actiniarum]WDD96973.1 acetate kinase [Thalassomonas actiniarum]